jgi:hypothetical protein
MKLNLGCGNKKQSGFINVDKFATESTDQIVDLEIIPWPWNENSISEIRLIHVLEHLGQSSEIYLGIIKEIYRICKNGATVTIHVPHPRHDNFIGDPTHVRAVTPQSLSLFDKSLNDAWKTEGISAATTLAHFMRVDIRVSSVTTVLDYRWQKKLNSGEMTIEEIAIAANDLNNVISEWHIECTIMKEL